MKQSLLIFILITITFTGASQTFDVVIRHGEVYNGLGTPPVVTDVGISKDTIAAIGDLSKFKGLKEIDATGLAVSPGFINMLSWSEATLLKDGRAMSDIKQGVTLEVMGEGLSAGPRKPRARDKRWNTLGQFFTYLERKGVSPNFASFVGATSIRLYVLDQADRAPTTKELTQMKSLVAQAMREGAMGLGSSLIYAPATFAKTEELIELSKIASSYGGMYITHMRSESDFIFQGMNETFRIAKEAGIAAEIYHLKINHDRNWRKIDTVLFKIDSARKAGLRITADIYPYHASGTSLTARLPAWIQEGGTKEMRKRLVDPVMRKRVLYELKMGIPSKNSNPKDVLLLGFRKDSLNRLYKGKRLDEVARLHGKDEDETMLDLLVADKTSIPAIFFLMSEENMKRMLRLPFVSICSDAAAYPAELPYLDEGIHPRAYGSFAKLLSDYVRDQKILTLEEAVRRMTSLPASNLKLDRRGQLRKGYFADIVVFDKNKVDDKSTYEKPHQYAEGVIHVFVNGKQVLSNGNHTGAKPGRALRGPGYN
ncbi:MAG TPA: D-aminoacylase [Cyclobacteriaceae bacterium]|nr:D-aminoacylase [Cyclobacteriaceae bacterium]